MYYLKKFNKIFFINLILSFLFISPSLIFAKDSNVKESSLVLGYIEDVRIIDVDIIAKAKLDTGAKTSSVNAKIIEQDEENVLFELLVGEKKGQNLKKKIIRTVKIKAKNGNPSIERPVVELEFCIAGKKIKEEVNLASRKGFNYDILVGRNMLKHANIAVDSNKKFTNKPNCN